MRSDTLDLSAPPPGAGTASPGAPATRPPADQRVRRLARGVWTRSIVGLALIALLATASFFILQEVLSINARSATVVNISGRQRMLSQRSAFFAARLAESTDAAQRREWAKEMALNAALLLESHEGLTQGSAKLGLPAEQSAAVERLYFGSDQGLDRMLRGYLEQLRLLGEDSGRTPDGTALARDNAHLRAVTELAAGPLLTRLNAVVIQYEQEGNAKVQRAILYERLVYAATLLTLLLEAVIIYRPLVNHVRRSTEALVRQQQFSDQVINTSQALIVGLNAQGRVTLFNDYSQRLSGYSEAEVKGQDFQSRLLPATDDAAQRAARNALFRDAAGEHTETPLLTRDGRRLTIDWSTTRLYDPISGEPSLLLATGVDITQRKKAQEDLQMALEQTAALGRRLQQEVEHAALLQRALLPPPEIDLPGLKGVAHLTTSSEVGGDYYDYYQVDGHHAVFLIGDVSGHGVASGTLVSAAKLAVHQLASRGETDPAAMLEQLNEALLTSSHDSMFMTMLCLSLDSRSGRLRVANAGHAFPYLWMAGEQGLGMLEVAGLPLGRVARPAYQPVSVDLAPGDRLFLYTDGLVEQEDPQGEALGHERLEELLYHVAALPLAQARDQVFEALARHAQGSHFADDVTVLLVEHHARVAQGEASPLRRADQRELVQLDAPTFLANPELPEHVSRQRIVLTHEAGQIGALLEPLCHTGVRRVLPSDQPFLRELGWQTLLMQHQHPAGDDIDQWLAAPTLAREWLLTHSDGKARTMDALAEQLAAIPRVPQELRDVLVLMADELIENSLYGAPLDPWQRKIYHKGQRRDVAPEEGIRVLLRLDDERLGLAVIDRWGSFTPAVFLQRLALNARQDGLVAGVGGAGLYLMWRMSDYLQVRVDPQRQTQITLLWSLRQAADPDRDSGFQFLFHHEVAERFDAAGPGAA